MLDAANILQLLYLYSASYSKNRPNAHVRTTKSQQHLAAFPWNLFLWYRGWSEDMTLVISDFFLQQHYDVHICGLYYNVNNYANDLVVN